MHEVHNTSSIISFVLLFFNKLASIQLFVLPGVRCSAFSFIF
jgi:hypothetical protein